MKGTPVRLGLWLMGLVGLSGCALALVGVGAAGGYAISRDSITNHVDLPLSHVYRVSREVVREVGLVSVEDESNGLIRATVEGVNVTVTVKRVSEQTVQLTVKARNQLLMPKIGVAHTVYNRIIQRL